MVCETCEEYGIECDLLDTPEVSLICSDTPDAEQALAQMREEAALRRADGFDCRFLDAAEATALGAGGSSNRLYIGGLCHGGRDMAATFHSGKYLFGLARGVGAMDGVHLFEQSRVVALQEDEGKVYVTTAGGQRVHAQHCLLATNATVPQFVPWLADCLHAERGQMAVTEPLDARPCVGCGSCSGTAEVPPTAWKDIPEPDGRWRLMVAGRSREKQKRPPPSPRAVLSMHA
eukprot:COSAG01_NODE_159_length_23702_cov_119.507585_28_plen_232_part_00